MEDVKKIETVDVIKAEVAAELAKKNPERKKALINALLRIDHAIRERAESGFRNATCEINFDGFDLERAIRDNLPDYEVEFKQIPTPARYGSLPAKLILISW